MRDALASLGLRRQPIGTLYTITMLPKSISPSYLSLYNGEFTQPSFRSIRRYPNLRQADYGLEGAGKLDALELSQLVNINRAYSGTSDRIDIKLGCASSQSTWRIKETLAPGIHVHPNISVPPNFRVNVIQIGAHSDPPPAVNKSITPAKATHQYLYSLRLEFMRLGLQLTSVV